MAGFFRVVLEVPDVSQAPTIEMINGIPVLADKVSCTELDGYELDCAASGADKSGRPDFRLLPKDK